MGAPMRVMKACGKCGRKLPRTDEYFYLDNRTGRYYAPCKECKAAAKKRRKKSKAPAPAANAVKRQTVVSESQLDPRSWVPSYCKGGRNVSS